MDLIGMEGITFFHRVPDPDNTKYGELLYCEYCGCLSEIYSDTCPFCGRRFVHRHSKTPYVPESEEE